LRRCDQSERRRLRLRHLATRAGNELPLGQDRHQWQGAQRRCARYADHAQDAVMRGMTRVALRRLRSTVGVADGRVRDRTSRDTRGRQRDCGKEQDLAPDGEQRRGEPDHRFQPLTGGGCVLLKRLPHSRTTSLAPHRRQDEEIRELAFHTGLCRSGAGRDRLDGKTMRRSFDKAGTQSPLPLVSAWAADLPCDPPDPLLDAPILHCSPIVTVPLTLSRVAGRHQDRRGVVPWQFPSARPRRPVAACVAVTRRFPTRRMPNARIAAN
jgi:hypothetical protein